MNTIDKAELVRRLSYVDPLRSGTNVAWKEMPDGSTIITTQGPDDVLLMMALDTERQLTQLFHGFPTILDESHLKDILKLLAFYFAFKVSLVLLNGDPYVQDVKENMIHLLRTHDHKRVLVLGEVFGKKTPE